MEVFVVIREDQNDHGFVDASVYGVYKSRTDAESCVSEAESEARTDGFRVVGSDSEIEGWRESEWQVYYKIERHELE